MTNERYTHGHHPSVLQSHTWRTVDNSAAYLAPLLVPGTTVLDVGSGPGTITVDIAQRVAPARVVGIDASAEVVEKSQALAEERELTNVEFVVGDAYQLDFADGSFDVVHAHQVLQHVARPVEVLREMRRVRTENGVVAARDVDYAVTAWFPLLPGLDAWLDLYSRVHRGNGGEPDAGRRLKAWAREAGFAGIDSSASSWCYASNDERRWWGGSWSERALYSDWAKGAREQGAATEEQLHEISDAWLEWAAHEDGWFSMTHGEVLARR